MSRKTRPIRLWLALIAAFGVGFFVREKSAGDAGGIPSSLFPAVLGQVQADLQSGEYQFLPNRRSIWVVNRTNGRMANYNFMNNESSTVQKSRVAQIDMSAFPRNDTFITLSDRSLKSVLWVCNQRTGDVAMWELDRDHELRQAGPIATSANLMDRAP